MAEATGTREGYLLLADIAGYTAFLTGTELEHAQGIIGELTSLIVDRLAPPLRFVKLEGDAVFCYAEAARFTHAERLLELIESCYFDFSNRLLDMQRSTTCKCAACAAIPTLDLKFVCHFGEFVVHKAGGSDDLAGSDVILVHRLLKNGVTESTGIRAYALFTEAYISRLPGLFQLPRHSESYESLGEISFGVHDVKAVCDAMLAHRREYIEPGAGDFEVTMSFDAPPAVIWQYWTDPEKRLAWSELTGLADTRNTQGRTGVGATSHCAHRNWSSLMEYIDWRPVRYYTVRRSPTKASFMSAPPSVETVEFIETASGGTDVHFRMKCTDRMGRLKVRLAGGGVRKMFARQAETLKVLLEDEPGAQASGAAAEEART